MMNSVPGAEDPPPPRIRRLPFQDNIHTSIFTPREYQVELLDAARKHNLIMCLGTIPSKSFISLMIIRELAHEIRHTEKDKRRWTVVIFTSEATVRRYAGLIRDHTDLKVGEFLQLDDKMWELKDYNVLVMTTDAFSKLLDTGVTILSRFNLLIIGDSHLTVKLDHTCHKIADAVRNFQPRLRILGLSANIMKTQCEEPHVLDSYMNLLERTLNCCVETASDIISLSRFGNRSNEIVVQCRRVVRKDVLNDQISKRSVKRVEEDEESSSNLEAEIRRIVESALNFVTDHIYRPEEIYGNLDEDLNIPDPNIIPKFYLNEILNHLSSLGPWCTNRAARRFLKELKKHKDDTPYERHYLLISMVYTTMEMVQATCEYYFRNLTEVEKILKYSSPKVLRLLDILLRFKPAESQIKQEEMPGKTESNESVPVKENCSSIVETEGDRSNTVKVKPYCEGNCFHRNAILKNCCNMNHENFKNSKLKCCEKFNDCHSGFKRDPPGHRNNFGFRNRFLHANYNVDDPNALCGLVFVDRRNTACIMHMLLKELSRHHDDYRFIAPNFLVGYSKSPVQKQQQLQQTENREMMVEHRKQEEVLRRFRLRECNLLVTTSVLQDGIDIPKCNLVVRFDLPRDYKAYVQCKGRARASKSHFVLLVESKETISFMNDLARFKTIEEVLLARCHEREIPTDEEVGTQKADDVLPPYSPEGGSGKVSMATAISLVNRYCAKLPSDTFTRLTPCCKLREVELPDHNLYQAVLFLPVNSPIKIPVVSPVMTSKAFAKMAAALEMCKVLHKAGELDDNLLPVGKESVQQEEELMDNWEDETVPEGAPKPGTTKRRQYYYKSIADAFVGCHPKTVGKNYLYEIKMTLSCPIPEEQNTRGRRIYAPEETNRCFGIITSKSIPKICGFPVFTRSGEVTVRLQQISDEIKLTDEQLEKLSFFHSYTFSKVLRLEKYPMKFNPTTAESSYFIVPLNKPPEYDFLGLGVDWDFVDLIFKQQNFKPRLIPDDERKEFKFEVSRYLDSVVMPWYRNLDQPQYFYVAEICFVLNPKSDFPDEEFESFENYYFKKYNIQIQRLIQPLLDVDHTSARLNLLTPRYVNRKGVALPTSSEETKRAKRENLQQKQILVPELCTIHPFPASFWRKAVCLPCVLYRANSLLVAEQLRVRVATEMGLGMKTIEEDFEWPVLDFGWSLADVFKAHAAHKEAAAAQMINSQLNASEASNPLTIPPVKSKIPRSRPVFTGWDCGDSSGGVFDIGTWSNDIVPADDSQPRRVGAFEGDFFDLKNLPSNLMMLNNGAIFEEEEPELKELGGDGDKKTVEWKEKDKPTIRIGSPSNFENDDGWEFDSGEEVDVMNIPGFSFISVSGGAFNLEDLSRDLEAYEEDGMMQTETFEDDEEKNDYPPISYWGGSNDESESQENGTTIISTLNAGKNESEIEDEDFILDWDEVGLSEEEKVANENEAKDYFELKMREKLKSVKIVREDEEIVLNGKTATSEVSSTSAETVEILKKPASLQPICTNNEMDTIRSIYPGSPDLEQFISHLEYNKDKLEHAEDNCDTVAKTESKFATNPVITEIANGTDEDSNATNSSSGFSFDKQTSLISHPGPSPSVILQALTMSNANDGINLERLETIGDSYLKHAITTYLYCTYPNIHEGKLSYLRSKQVSNLNLYRLGKLKGLGEFMVATKFEPNDNWLPPGYFVPKELEQALIDSGIPAGHWNIANLPDLQDWKDLNAEEIRKALVKPMEEGENGEEIAEVKENGFEADLAEYCNFHQITVPKEVESESNAVEEGAANPSEPYTCFIPYNLMTQHSIPDKSIADCVEALIGAYLTSCGPRGALLFMSWLGIKVLPQLKCDDSAIPQFGYLSPPPSPLLYIVPDPQMELDILLHGYDAFEEKIQYKFRDRSYLLQAFTHASYHYNRLTDCYQRLEFLGDAVLDYLITRHLYEDPRQHSPGTLTDLRSALVNNTIFATLAVKHDFHKYFKAICPGLFVVIDKFVQMQKENDHKLNEEYYFIEEDECEEAEDIEVPKALGDVFESVAGAIYLDSGMSLDKVWHVYYNMMKSEIEQFMTNVPKSPIRELLEMEPETAKFGIPEKTLEGKVRVTVEIFGKGKFRGLGRNYRIAKCTAAKHALKALKRMHGLNS